MPEAARVGVDVGGTFTDVVLAMPDGRLTVAKVPSTPGDQSEGFAAGIHDARDRTGSPEVAAIAHGTTVATNAVLERRGAATGLLTTEGFRDMLIIGRQQRPRLYDLGADRPAPLIERRHAAGVPERVAADGSVLQPLDIEAARAAIARLRGEGVASFAVCLLFSFADPSHERALAALIEEIAPDARISLSCDVLPEFREYERASTTVLDAYVGPVVERYMARLVERVSDLEAPVSVMRSGGGTMAAHAAAAEPVHTLLSGPAAGVRGAALVARAAGFADIVTFDMGGTSTDVCLVEDGEPAVSSEGSIGGLPFRTPSLAIHTIGAGGGSVLWIDEAGALRAGPRSAGADPGPACYARGGVEPAITDAHAVLGHLDAAGFLGGRMRLDAAAAQRAVNGLAARLGAPGAAVAQAGLDAARAAMANAIRVVTVERGRDPRAFALVAFGGAGPMHATALAEELDIGTVLIPPASGALSALGLLTAPLTADASRTHPAVDPAPEDLQTLLEELAAEAVERLRAQGADAGAVTRAVDCRSLGQAHEVTVDADPLEDLVVRFHAEHRARFGWDAPGEPMQVVTLRARASAPPPPLSLPRLARGEGARATARRALGIDGETIDAPAYARAAFGAGDRITGPCVVDSDDSTTLIDPGWEAEIDQHGTIVVVRV